MNVKNNLESFQVRFAKTTYGKKFLNLVKNYCIADKSLSDIPEQNSLGLGA